MSQVIEVEEWLKITEAASEELVTTTLGYEGCAKSEVDILGDEQKYGSCVELLNDDMKMTIGIVTNREGSQKITESLLGMEPMSEEDEADALGEVANILAGSIKTKAGDRVNPLQLGLPFYFKGEIHFKEPIEMALSHETWGDVKISLLVVQRTN